MTCLLFVTAPEADHKAINKALLYLRDFEYCGNDSFKLVSTRNAYDLDPPPGQERVSHLEATTPPVDKDLSNAWLGASIREIEEYCIELERGKTNSVNTHLFVVIDGEGFREKTCVLAEREADWESEPIQYPERFNKCNQTRIPWDETYLMWCNLDIANMGFEEFTNDDKDEHGWFTYNSVNDGPTASEENIRQRDDEIERLRAEGKA